VSRALTSTEVCRLLGISSKTLYLWERQGKIPAAARNRRGWRVFSPKQVESIRRYLGQDGLEEAPPAERREKKHASGLSARNQLVGRVTSIRSDGLLAEVVLELPDGQEIVSVITRSSVKRLGIRKGHNATAVIKATEVMLFK
jgi:molybdopterin-binding protein